MLVTLASRAMDFSKCLEQIVESARSKRLSLWVGAGISTPTFPLGNELKFYILEKICIEANLSPLFQDHLQEGKDLGTQIEGYPLEAFIERICDCYDIVPALAELFTAGTPNKNHNTIARLIERQYLRNVLTTNFDLLIERALEQIGWLRQVDFEVFSTEKDFHTVDFNQSSPAIFKIHGSADDKDSMRVTLKQVASRRLSDSRARVLGHLLTSEKGDMLVLGYGAKDYFDINPILSSMIPEKRIFYVDHCTKKTEVGKLPDAFRNFEGFSIVCDAERAWSCLREALLDE